MYICRIITASIILCLVVTTLAYAKTAEDYLESGHTKLVRKDYKGVIEDLNKAIELNPKYLRAYYSRGLVKNILGDYKGAIEDLNKVIELDPKTAKAYNHRGRAKDKLGDYKGAIQDYNKAIELYPKYTDAYHYKRIAKGKLGDYNKANVIDDSKEPSGTFVLRATSGNLKGDILTLNGVPNVIYLTDRGSSKHLYFNMSISKFVELWPIWMNKRLYETQTEPPTHEEIRNMIKGQSLVATFSVLKKKGDKKVVADVTLTDEVRLIPGVIQFRVERTKGSPTTMQEFESAQLSIDIAKHEVCTMLYYMTGHVYHDFTLYTYICDGLFGGNAPFFP